MSRPISRLGDTTIGKCTHPDCINKPVVYGQIVSASANRKANTRGVARVGDTVLCELGHPGTIITGDTRIITNSRPTARVGDQFVGTYSGTIITGSPTVISG